MTVYYGGSKIKDVGEYGVYLGSQNTNCLTYTPKNVNLTLDPLIIEKVGNITIANGVASGFTSSIYLKTPEVFNPLTSSFEAVFKINITTAAANPILAQGATTQFHRVLIGVNKDGTFYFRLGSGSGWKVALISKTALSVGVDYWLKFVMKAGTFYIYYSTDGKEYVLDNSVADTDTFNAMTQQAFIGRASDTAEGTKYFHGTIDLSQSYIKIADSIWWKGGTGALTLKKGSKVYVPNGKNADGSLKFDEVVIESDVSTTRSANNQEMYFVSKGGATFNQWLYVYSGTSEPIGYSGNYAVWYDTANNLVKRTTDGGSTWVSGFSLPVCLATSNTASITSIDQIFDWCGYIGSTAFVLPGVKGLIPNGFNADGTYKSIEFETDRVVIRTTNNETSDCFWVYRKDTNSFNYAPKAKIFYQDTEPTVTNYRWYDTKTNLWKVYTANGTEIRQECPVFDNVLSSGVITSLTPYTAQPSTTVIPFKEIYNGSQLVYQYKQPGEVLFEQSTAGTYTFTAPYNTTVDVVLVGGGGGGSDSWAGYRKTGGSAGMVTGSITVTKGTTYTIVVGGGGAYGYGSAVDKPGQGATGGTTSAFGNNAYGGAGGYTHAGYGSVNAHDGAGGSFSTVGGFTGSNGVAGSTANRYGNYGGGGFGSANGAGGYVRITVKG